MAYRTVGFAFYVIGSDKIPTLFIFRRLLQRIAGRKHRVARPYMVLRMAMATETPLHVQGGCAIHQWHLIHGAVTGRARHALLHVNAVIEVNEIRQIVHAIPNQRLPIAKARPHRLEHRALRPNLAVAIHARLRRRNSGKGRRLDAGVAITTIDPGLRNVVLMAEWHGLFPDYTRVRDIWRADHSENHPTKRGQNEHGAKNREARNRVHAGMKYLRHDIPLDGAVGRAADPDLPEIAVASAARPPVEQLTNQ
jgi:hypothetical protein